MDADERQHPKIFREKKKKKSRSVEFLRIPSLRLAVPCQDKLFLVRIGKGQEPNQNQDRDGRKEHRHEEDIVAQPVAEESAHHSRYHHAEVHDSRSERIVRHLVLARRDLLHHEQRQSDEAEAISEVLDGDGATDEERAVRLVNRQQRIDREREVEHAAEREQGFFQSVVRDVIAGEERTEHERRRAEAAVVQSDFLLRQSEPAGFGRRLEEERDDFHHQSFGKAVEDDEDNIQPDVFLLEEGEDDLFQRHPRVVHRRHALFSALDLVARQHPPVVKGKQQHDGTAASHNGHPRMDYADMLDEIAREIDQPAGRRQFGYIIERALPADVFRLVVLAQHRHINAVGRHVVRRPAEGNHGKKGNRDGKEVGQLQRQCHQSEEDSGAELRQHHEELLRLEHFEERTPEGFDGPRKHDDRRPEGNLRIGDSQALEHKRRHHIQYDKRHTHCEVNGRDPCNGRDSVFDCVVHSASL